MTPIPLNLPLRTSEAAELGRLIFEHAESKSLTADLRNRLAARAAVLPLESVTPYFGSLVRDPVHPSTYYLAVDGEERVPLLLHIAPAAAPTSSVFHKPLLIGRLRTTAGRELVINAVPFGPSDGEALDRFAAELDSAFLPQARGARPAVAAAAAFPDAFAAFRAALKRYRINLAAVAASPESPAPLYVYHAAQWSAIRAGWREGFTARLGLRLASESLDHAREIVGRAPCFTHYAIDGGCLPLPAALKAADQIYEAIRETRSVSKIARPFDFEFSLETAPEITTPANLALCLHSLRERGHSAQFVRPAPASDLDALAAVARDFQCALSVRETSTATVPSPGSFYELATETANTAERITLAAESFAG